MTDSRSEQSERGSTPVATIILTVAGVVVALAGMKAMASILAPTFLTLFLVITFRPVSVALQRRRGPRIVTMLLTMVIIYGVLIVLGLTIYLSITKFASTLLAQPEKFQDLVTDATNALHSLGVTSLDTSTLTDLVSPARIASLATSLVSASAAVASVLALIVALVFFMAVDADSFSRRLDLVVRFRPATAAAFLDLGRTTRSYYIVAASFGAVVAVVDWILLLLVGVPDAWLWALLAFVTNFVPNVGFILGLIPPAVLALVTIDWQAALIIVIAYCLINVVIQVMIQPMVVGDRVQLNSTLTFLALIVWTFVLGWLGAILAIPMTLLVRALFVDSYPKLRWVRDLFGGGEGGPKRGRGGARPVTKPAEAHESTAASETTA